MNDRIVINCIRLAMSLLLGFLVLMMPSHSYGGENNDNSGFSMFCGGSAAIYHSNQSYQCGMPVDKPKKPTLLKLNSTNWNKRYVEMYRASNGERPNNERLAAFNTQMKSLNRYLNRHPKALCGYDADNARVQGLANRTLVCRGASGNSVRSFSAIPAPLVAGNLGSHFTTLAIQDNGRLVDPTVREVANNTDTTTSVYNSMLADGAPLVNTSTSTSSVVDPFIGTSSTQGGITTSSTSAYAGQ